MVNCRYLGNSGLKVTEIIYGNWITHAQQIGDDTAAKCVRAALDNGITTFDTADAYAGTKAEVVLGDLLKGENREQIEVFTKTFWGVGPGVNQKGLSRKALMAAIDGSLKRLQMDYVDVWFAHRYDYETPLEETMNAFADAVHAGKAHYIGVSEWPADKIRQAVAMGKELGIQVIASQPQYNMLYRVIEAEVIPASIETGVGQVVWSPIAQGLLTGKYLPAQALPEGSRATDESGGKQVIAQHFEKQGLLEAIQQLKPIAEGLDLSMAQLAVAWVLANDNVSAAIIGASRPEQVIENVKASGVTLPAEAMAAIDVALEGFISTDPQLTITNNPAGRP